ncbi:MAG: hypothetical protein QUU85_12955 [Candidatus Eisenbacteria bacterium]|nr:hypothetical protein [Candidatus Eisenbacteria bacterium]
MSFVERLVRLDRRWVFLFIMLSVSLPLFLRVDQRIDVTPEVRGAFAAVEALPPGSKVILACDYDPGSAAEIQPMTVAFLKQAFARRLRVIIVGLWPQGPQQADLALAETLQDPAISALQPRYGVDFVNLGFQSGNEVVVQRMGSGIPAVFPRDYRGRPVGQFPIMSGVRDFTAIALVFNVSAGYPGIREWIQFAGDRFDTPIVGALTAVSAPRCIPTIPTRWPGCSAG